MEKFIVKQEFSLQENGALITPSEEPQELELNPSQRTELLETGVIIQVTNAEAQPEATPEPTPEEAPLVEPTPSEEKTPEEEQQEAQADAEKSPE